MTDERAGAQQRLTGALLGTLIFAVSLLAVVLGTSIAVRAAPVLDGVASYARVLAWQFAVWLPWILGALVVFRLATRVQITRLRLPAWVAAHLTGSAIIAGVHAAWFIAVSSLISPFRGFEDTKYGAYQYFFIYWFLCDLLIYWAVLGFAYGRDYYHRFVVRDRQSLQLEARLAEAQLEALRLQIRPHLLFNVLNTVVSMLRAGEADKALQMILALSDLLRQLLAQHDSQEIPLGQELELTRSYLHLEQRRFEDRLTVDLRLDDDTLGLLVPILILQPLVENAIRHGVARSTRPCTLTVRSECRGDRLVLEVSDTGSDPNRAGDEPAGLGIGVGNTRARLQELYGLNHSFAIVKNAADGVTVTIVIPARRERSGRVEPPAA